MTTVFGSIVTSVMADGQAWLAQAVAQWGWSGQEAFVARAIHLWMTADQN